MRNNGQDTPKEKGGDLWIQDREGLPPELTELERFFELYGRGKASTPPGWNNPGSWKSLEEIPEGKPFGFVACGHESTLGVIDYDHVLDDNGRIYQQAYDILKRVSKIGKTYTEISISGHGLHQIVDLGDFAENFSSYKGQAIRWEDPEAKIELFSGNDGQYFVLTGKHSRIARQHPVATGETAAAIWHEYVKILEEQSGQSSERKEKKHQVNERGLIPEGQRHYYVVDMIGKLVGKLGSDVSADAILALIEEDFKAKCESPDNVDMKEFREKYRKTIETFQKRREEEDNDPDFWSRAMSAWGAENPGVEFSGDWEAVRKAGERAKESSAIPGLSDEVKNAAADDQIIVQEEDRTAEGGGFFIRVGGKALKYRTMAEVEAKDPPFLIPDYIPKGAVTIIFADGGTGKTSTELDIAAAISSGTQSILQAMIPNEQFNKEYPLEPQRVLILSGEESQEYTLKYRLEHYENATMSNILTTTPEDGEAYEALTPLKGQHFEALIAAWRPALCIIDPLQSFLEGSVDMSRRNEMRHELDCLIRYGKDYGVTFLIAMHTNKKEGATGRNKLSDSSDMWDIARSVLQMGWTQKKGIRFLSHEKSNWGRLQDTIEFTVEDGGKVVFLGTTQKNAAAYAEENRGRRNEAQQAQNNDEAQAAVIEFIAEAREISAKELRERMIDSGYSQNAYKTACKMLRDKKRIKGYSKSNGYGKGTEYYYRIGDPETIS